MADAPKNFHSQDSFWFALNGERVKVRADEVADASVTLNEFLRSTRGGCPSVKLSCGQGGCGACTVALTEWLPGKQPQTETVNSCLMPLVAVAGLGVTTNEGLYQHGKHAAQSGGEYVREHPIQRRLGHYFGSQCGFCTPGMIMQMYGALAGTDGGRKTDAVQMEKALECGNICRCTGYRPILDAAKSFCSSSPTSNTVSEMDDSTLQGPYDSAMHDPDVPPWLSGSTTMAISLKLGKPTASSPGQAYCRPADLPQALHFLETFPNAIIFAGHTSAGIYGPMWEVGAPDIIPPPVLDISRVAAFRQLGWQNDGSFVIGAATTLEGLARFLEKDQQSKQYSWSSTLVRQIRTISGFQIRSRATIGGHLCLARNGFASDLAPLFVALNSIITVQQAETTSQQSLETWFDASRVARELVVAVAFRPQASVTECLRVAQRARDAKAHLNAAFTASISDGRILSNAESPRVVYGALGTEAPTRCCRAEQALTGQFVENLIGYPIPLSLQSALDADLEDFSLNDGQRALVYALVATFISKLYSGTDLKGVSARPMPHPDPFHGAVVLHTSHQTMPSYKGLAPFGTVGGVKDRIQGQTGGDAVYVADVAAARAPWPPPAPCPTRGGDLYFPMRAPSDTIVPAPLLPRGQLKAAVVQCLVPAGSQLTTIQSPPNSWGVRFFGARDFPNAQVAAGMLRLVVENSKVPFWGAPCGIIVAETLSRAQWAAEEMAQNNLVVSLPKEKPLVCASQVRDETIFDGNLLGEWSARRGDVAAAFEAHVGKECWAYANGTIEKGGQIHWYMEPQSVYVELDEGGQLIVNSSSQGPGIVNQFVATTLNVEQSKVDVKTRRLGGGFGGKFIAPGIIACLAANAARSTGRPVQLVLPRHVDSQIVGNRPRLNVKYELLVNKQTGLMEALRVDIVMAVGNNTTVDEAELIRDLDGCLWIPNIAVRLRGFRTASANTTAVRSPGHHEAAVLSEIFADHGAHAAGLSPAEFRLRNFLKTPVDGVSFMKVNGKEQAGHPITDTHIIPLLFESLLQGSRLTERQRDVSIFNSASPFRKRGIGVSMIRYKVTRFGEKTALVNMFGDGSVVLHVSGNEMGQGLHTKVIMIARRILSSVLPPEMRPLPAHLFTIADTSTKVMNMVDVTGGSVGSEMNVFAVEDACLQLVARLQAAGLPKTKPGATALQTWQQILARARSPSLFMAPDVPQASFSALGRYSAPPEEKGYMTYCGSVVEAEVDGLTGEYHLRHASVHFEGGPVMHGGVEIGQIEGAYVMGMGAMTSEDVMYNVRTSRLMNDNTWRYKLPLARDLPADFRVEITNCAGMALSGEDTNASTRERLRSSRATGEPPLLSATAVLSAIREGVAAFGDGRNFVELPVPCTVEAVQAACAKAMATVEVQKDSHARL